MTQSSVSAQCNVSVVDTSGYAKLASKSWMDEKDAATQARRVADRFEPNFCEGLRVPISNGKYKRAAQSTPISALNLTRGYLATELGSARLELHRVLKPSIGGDGHIEAQRFCKK